MLSQFSYSSTGGNFDIPEYPPGEGPPKEPYAPKLPTNKTSPKKKKFLLKNRKRQSPNTIKKDVDESVYSVKTERALEEDNLSQKDDSSNDTSYRKESQIELTLQYYEQNRADSPPIPTIRRRLEEEAMVAMGTNLPELKSRPNSTISKATNSQNSPKINPEAVKSPSLPLNIINDATSGNLYYNTL